ncbi:MULTISPECIES: hypothetical protein [Mycobacterium]|nr:MULTISPECIES: hypothetical protein [Mycobacterium]MDP7728472.1 hypothetical protein [Mycobacterium sp. TY813]
MTIYKCDHCGKQVRPGEGYIHTTHEHGKYWAIHHRECADLTREYCIAVPEHWSDLLFAHRDMSERRKVSA